MNIFNFCTTLSSQLFYLITDKIGITAPTFVTPRYDVDGNPVVGCRKPDTIPGTWDGAYIAIIHDSFVTAAYFQEVDFITTDMSWRFALTIYREHVLIDGWLPMSDEDIQKTSGICMNRVISKKID